MDDVGDFRMADYGEVTSKEIKLGLCLLTEYDDDANDEQQRNNSQTLQRNGNVKGDISSV